MSNPNQSHGHNAFKVTVLLENQQYKITCLEAWENQLVIGTDKGHIIVYDIQQKEESDGKTVFLSNPKSSFKDFTKKEINQLTFCNKQKIMFCLSDTLLTIGSLPSFRKLHELTRYKGCYLYSIDKSEDQLRVALAMKKKLVICEWINDDLVQKKELSLPGTVQVCMWSGQNSICLGFKTKYMLVNIDNGTPTDIFDPGKNGPVAAYLPHKQYLLCKDNYSYFIGHDGKPTRKFGLSWTSAPTVMESAFPYVVAILNNGSVGILATFSSSLNQLFTLPGASLLASTNDGNVYVASSSKPGMIWILSPLPFGDQIDSLVKKKAYAEALDLCKNLEKNQIPDYEEKFQNVQLLNAYDKFSKDKLEEAMQTFRDLKTDPLRVIALFGEHYLPASLRSQYKFPPEIKRSDKTESKAYLLELQKYLESKRKELRIGEVIQDKINPDNSEWDETQSLAQIIDTTLLKCYYVVDPSQIPKFLTQTNYCHFKQCKEFLWGNKGHKVLVELYQSRGDHKHALDYLKKLGEIDNPKTELSGTRESIKYMKGLGNKDLDLIFEFTPWIHKVTPGDVLQIFTAERLPTQELSRAKVLNHLETTLKDNKLVMSYLEYIINELHDQTPDFHNKLVMLYFDQVLEEINKNNNNTPLRKTLIKFLTKSKFYVPGLMLSRFDFSALGLHEEKAILHSKIGDHRGALVEYVHKLKDFKQAEEYCKLNYDPENEEGERDVFLYLFEVLMDETTPGSSIEFHKAAFNLLNRYYKEIDASKALKLLPDNTPMSDLESYFEKILREINRNRANKQIVSNLVKCETLKVKAELLMLKSRSVTINEDRMCAVCNKRLGHAAFAYYPNGIIVHYLCWQQQSDKKKCPVTGMRFDTAALNI